MATPRANLVDLEATSFFHCIARCVRRAYLCGQDALTGKSFDHRKSWIFERMAFLATIFAVNVCAYAESTAASPLASPGDLILRSSRNPQPRARSSLTRRGGEMHVPTA
jgi:hypothetical protein